jgi:hypothetical protein
VGALARLGLVRDDLLLEEIADTTRDGVSAGQFLLHLTLACRV